MIDFILAKWKGEQRKSFREKRGCFKVVEIKIAVYNLSNFKSFLNLEKITMKRKICRSYSHWKK